MNLKIGNSVALLFSLADKNGRAITNLSSALTIKFMVKINQADANADAIISKDLTNGVSIDSPNTGNIKVLLTAADTTINAGKYFIALQVQWVSNVYEVNIRETIDDIVSINTVNFIQDIIR